MSDAYEDDESLDEWFQSGQHREFDENCGSCEAVRRREAADLFRHSVIKNWRDGQLGFHVHLRTCFAFADLDAGEYCARFEQASELLNSHDRGRPPQDGDFNIGVHKAGRGREKKTMLVPVVDFLKVPEGYRLGISPAVVWLQALNRCSIATRGVGHLVPGRAEARITTSDRELNTCFLSLRPRPADEKGEVIKSGAEVMGAVPQHEAKHRGHGLNFANGFYQPALSVLITQRGIEVRLKELVRNATKSLMVLTGPPDLPSDRVEWVRHQLASDGHGHVTP